MTRRGAVQSRQNDNTLISMSVFATSHCARRGKSDFAVIFCEAPSERRLSEHFTMRRAHQVLTPSLPTPSIVGVQFLLAAAQSLL